MYKLFIDTNKFLDFYRNKEENKEILNEISKCNNIILTEQVVDEFKRNRNKEIKSLIDKVENVKKSAKSGMFGIEPIGILQFDIENINRENRKRIFEIEESFDSLLEKIKDMIFSSKNDPVLNTFNKIINNPNTIVLKHNNLFFELAHKRNELGGIPRSDKSGMKHQTICDEYIWETIINESKWDLIFVTRDNTYIDNKNLLKDEYKEKTNKNIIFTQLISEGLDKLGSKISDSAIEIEIINNISIEEKTRLENAIGSTFDNIINELNNLSKKEKDIIMYRFGLKDGKSYTLEELGNMYGKTREDVRQIEAKIIRKLREKLYKIE